MLDLWTYVCVWGCVHMYIYKDCSKDDWCYFLDQAKGLVSEYQPKFNSARAVYRERKKYVDEIDCNMLAVPPTGSPKVIFSLLFMICDRWPCVSIVQACDWYMGLCIQGCCSYFLFLMGVFLSFPCSFFLVIVQQCEIHHWYHHYPEKLCIIFRWLTLLSKRSLVPSLSWNALHYSKLGEVSSKSLCTFSSFFVESCFSFSLLISTEDKFGIRGILIWNLAKSDLF